MSVDLSSLGNIKLKNSDNKTLTLSIPTGLSADLSAPIETGKRIVRTAIASNVTLSADESGQLIPVSCAGVASTITLPPAVAGLRYRFVISTAGAKDMVLDGDGAETFEGYLIGATTAVACAGKATITLTAAKCLVGDSVDVECYATGRWAVRGFAQTAGAFA